MNDHYRTAFFTMYGDNPTNVRTSHQINPQQCENEERNHTIMPTYCPNSHSFCPACWQMRLDHGWHLY